MSFRIVLDSSGERAVLRIYGSLDADGLGTLQRSCQGCQRPLVLDLAQLRSIDDVGAAYLRGLVDAGVEVVGRNPFVTALLQLGEPGSHATHHPHRAPSRANEEQT